MSTARRVMTHGTRGQVVWATQHAPQAIVALWVDGVVVGRARFADATLVAEVEGQALPALGEPTAALDCVLYERLEERLRQGDAPPLPVMPALPRRPRHKAPRLDVDDDAAA